MSDLDDDLLALAGAGTDESDADFDDVPLKRVADSEGSAPKRARTGDSEDSNEAEDDGGDAADDQYEEEEVELKNPYPLEGKYIDEEDRENLLEMDEVQREQILFDRSLEMERYTEKKYLQQRMKQQKQQSAGAGDKKATRSSNRTKQTVGNKSSKLDKLSELRKQREQKTRRQTGGDDYEDEDDEDDDEPDEEDEEDAYGYEEEVVWGSTNKSKYKPRSYERATIEDIKKIQVGRSLLAKHCFYSNFSDVVVDTFGKINLGMDKRTRKPIYRMVQIVDVKSVPEKPYNLPSTKCDIYLTVSQNRSQKKDFPISIFSDGDISLEEFERYLKELSKTDDDLPYQFDVEEKHEQLQSFLNKGLSDKDVNDMIEKKQKLQGTMRSFDAVFQKTKLMDELKIAKQRNEPEKVKQLTEKIKLIENMLLSNAAQNETSGMSKVNERNRKLNQTNVRKAELKNISELKKALEAKEDTGGDPFSRLKTVTRMFYQDLVNQENEKALEDAKRNYENKMAEKSKSESKIASSTYRVLGYMDKLIGEIEIDLDLDI